MITLPDISTWTCPGQSDLTEIVETEHISGSVPAGTAEALAARLAFYQELLASYGRDPGAQP